jgi:ABC-type branched-subunit amino acid transport system ATPase component
MPPEFELDGVCHSFGNVPALDNCELTIERSSTTAIVGPNGAGKSTLLDVLSGQVTPDAGRVYHRGDEITRVDAVDASKRGIVRTFQRPRLFPNLTVAENLQIGYFDDDTDLLASVLGRCSTNEELRAKFETHLDNPDWSRSRVPLLAPIARSCSTNRQQA